MRRILILLVFSLLFCGNVTAQDQQSFIIIPQTKETEKDFLDMFTEEEKCIILSIEPQLDIFAMFYSYHHTGITSTASVISLFDVASLYYNDWTLWVSANSMSEDEKKDNPDYLKKDGFLKMFSKKKTLDGFLDYIIAPSLNHRTNIDKNIEAFKKKVYQDYNFIKARREKKNKEEKEEKDFFEFIFRIYKELLKNPKAQQYFNKLKLELER